MPKSVEDLVAAAIGDPTTHGGHRAGPTWGEGNPGYAPTEETTARWAARAVLASLNQAGVMTPTHGRMATFFPGGNGRTSTAIVQLEGAKEILRFMIHTLAHQCDIARAGRAVLVGLRDHVTPEVFDSMAFDLLGKDLYEKRRKDFERDWECRGCERDIHVGHRYYPTDDAGAICAGCTSGYPEYEARLVKRAPDVAPPYAGVPA